MSTLILCLGSSAPSRFFGGSVRRTLRWAMYLSLHLAPLIVVLRDLDLWFPRSAHSGTSEQDEQEEEDEDEDEHEEEEEGEDADTGEGGGRSESRRVIVEELWRFAERISFEVCSMCMCTYVFVYVRIYMCTVVCVYVRIYMCTVVCVYLHPRRSLSPAHVSPYPTP
jgi:hypothetical protein